MQALNVNKNMLNLGYFEVLEHDGARMVFLTIKIFHIKCLQLTCLIFCARVCYDLNKKKRLDSFSCDLF